MISCFPLIHIGEEVEVEEEGEAEKGALEDATAGRLSLMSSFVVKVVVERGAMRTLMNIMMRRKMQMED